MRVVIVGNVDETMDGYFVGGKRRTASPTEVAHAPDVQTALDQLQSAHEGDLVILDAQAFHQTISPFWGRPLAEVERTLIMETLKQHLGNRTHTAKALGISIRTLRNKIHQYIHEGHTILPHLGTQKRWSL